MVAVPRCGDVSVIVTKYICRATPPGDWVAAGIITCGHVYLSKVELAPFRPTKKARTAIIHGLAGSQARSLCGAMWTKVGRQKGPTDYGEC